MEPEEGLVNRHALIAIETLEHLHLYEHGWSQ